jgi:regulator of telomere elongation helicase 1
MDACNEGVEPERVAKPRVRIIYASRTHSQLTQVIRELKKTSCTLRVSVIGSRDHLCIRPDVLASGKGGKDAACQRLVRKEKCQYYFGTEGKHACA